MAIVSMTKFDLMIHKDDTDSVLRRLQCFGDVHFRQLKPDDDGFLHTLPAPDVSLLEAKRTRIQEYIREIERFERSSRFQMSSRERRRYLKSSVGTESLPFEELERRALQIDIDSLIGSMDESAAHHEGEHSRRVLYYIEPWAQNKLKDSLLVSIRDAEPIIGTVSADNAELLAQDIREAGHIYAIVCSTPDESITFVIKAAEDQAEHALILTQKYHMERRSEKSIGITRELRTFRQKMDRMISRRHRTDGSLEKLSRHKQDLMIYHEYIENLIIRRQGMTKFVQTESTLVISGWVATAQKEDFCACIADACGERHVLKLEEVARNTQDAPVRLQNNRFTAAFENITSMYAMPLYNELDPTPIFAPFYLLFFGMMLADVGYGLLMMGILFAALKIFTFKPSFEKMLKFLFYLSFSTIFWGFIYGSFFGGIVSLPALIDPNNEFTRVLIMAIAFGIVHLFVALGVKAYIYIRDGFWLYAIFDVGFWYMTILGALGFGLNGYVPALAPFKTICMVVMIVGMAGILLTNGRSARTPFGKLASGLYSLYGITNYVSDIVSYSRLMALGLAGGSIGIAINMMVNMVAGIGPIGIIIGAGIFIGAHMFNLFISGLSAYVHSSRLIYVEFFGKFFTGGGTAFTPFRAQTKYINIT